MALAAGKQFYSIALDLFRLRINVALGDEISTVSDTLNIYFVVGRHQRKSIPHLFGGLLGVNVAVVSCKEGHSFLSFR